MAKRRLETIKTTGKNSLRHVWEHRDPLRVVFNFAIFDIFYPELIEIGDNSIVGYNTTILAHEFLVNELRTGKVRIGKNVLVGANTTILAGVEIGDGSTISAATLVDQDIPPNSFAKGNPMKAGGKK